MRALVRRGTSGLRPADIATLAVVVTGFVSMVAAAAPAQPYTPGELGLLAGLCGLYLWLGVHGWAWCERMRAPLLTGGYFGTQFVLALVIGVLGRGSGGFWILMFPLAGQSTTLTWPWTLGVCAAILAFYSAFSGYRVLHRKRPQRGRGATWLDWAGASLALGSGAGCAAWGVGSLVGWLPLSFGTVFSGLGIAFGALLGKQALEDLRSFRRPAEDRNWWWYVHMDRMLGSSIGALTAFLVQNVGRHLAPEVGWLVWVLPGLLGGPAIGYWVNHYRRRFARVQQERSSRGSAAESAPAPASPA